MLHPIRGASVMLVYSVSIIIIRNETLARSEMNEDEMQDEMMMMMR
jgi:hypothetical protein